MTSAAAPSPRWRRSALAVLGALRSARSWRATWHALLGLPVGLFAGAVLAVVLILWAAAILSLIDGPTGHWLLPAVYVLTAVLAPIPLLGCVHAFSALQRDRFRALLGIDIRTPRPVGTWPLRLVRPWLAADAWRQLGYHVLAVVIGTVGGVLVAVCWLAAVAALGYAGGFWGDSVRPGVAVGGTALALGLLLAAPWLARGVATVDTRAARALLGPGRSEELVERVESLTRSRAEVVAATDAERRRIERDLHDGAQQRLVALAMNLGMARANLVDVPEHARRAIEQAHDEAIQALAELREFVRGLHPAVLNDRGLDAALSGIAARAPLPVRLRVDVPGRCSPTIEAVAYFVVSEALTNVAKHARASRAEVAVDRIGDRLRLVVTDDGRGGATLDLNPELDRAGAAPGGSGLRGLAHRAAAVDGTLTVHSPPGGPTTVTVELPCES